MESTEHGPSFNAYPGHSKLPISKWPAYALGRVCFLLLAEHAELLRPPLVVALEAVEHGLGS